MVEISEKTKQFNARVLQDLISLGKSRGYKNPQYWAFKIIESRTKKNKINEKNQGVNINENI